MHKKLLHEGKVGSGRKSLTNAFLGFHGWVDGWVSEQAFVKAPKHGSYLNETLRVWKPLQDRQPTLLPPAPTPPPQDYRMAEFPGSLGLCGGWVSSGTPVCTTAATPCPGAHSQGRAAGWLWPSSLLTVIVMMLNA